jgi:DNA-directed RNA polymerase specialized sigma24 family protein
MSAMTLSSIATNLDFVAPDQEGAAPGTVLVAHGEGTSNKTMTNGQESGKHANVPKREEEWSTWMCAAISGDAIAYRRFLGSVALSLRAQARRRLACVGLPVSDSEDVVQEVLLAIHLKRHTWDRSRPVVSWISAIARNKFVDVLRRHSHRIDVPIESVIENLAAEEKEEGLGHRDLDRMLDTLSDRQCDIVRSVSINGASVRQTGAAARHERGRRPRRASSSAKDACSAAVSASENDVINVLMHEQISSRQRLEATFALALTFSTVAASVVLETASSLFNLSSTLALRWVTRGLVLRPPMWSTYY